MAERNFFCTPTCAGVHGRTSHPHNKHSHARRHCVRPEWEHLGPEEISSQPWGAASGSGGFVLSSPGHELDAVSGVSGSRQDIQGEGRGTDYVTDVSDNVRCNGASSAGRAGGVIKNHVRTSECLQCTYQNQQARSVVAPLATCLRTICGCTAVSEGVARTVRAPCKVSIYSFSRAVSPPPPHSSSDLSCLCPGSPLVRMSSTIAQVRVIKSQQLCSSLQPGDFLRIQYEVGGKVVVHEAAALHRVPDQEPLPITLIISTTTP